MRRMQYLPLGSVSLYFTSFIYPEKTTCSTGVQIWLVHHLRSINLSVLFLAPLAVGQRAYVMVRCPSCIRASVRPCVRPSIRPFSLNIFFAETTYRILMKFHRNVPTMVLFRISWNNFIPSKTLVAMATKLKFFWNLRKSSCQKP